MREKGELIGFCEELIKVIEVIKIKEINGFFFGGNGKVEIQGKEVGGGKERREKELLEKRSSMPNQPTNFVIEVLHLQLVSH